MFNHDVLECNFVNFVKNQKLKTNIKQVKIKKTKIKLTIFIIDLKLI